MPTNQAFSCSLPSPRPSMPEQITRRDYIDTTQAFDFGLDSRLTKVFGKLGFTHPTFVQVRILRFQLCKSTQTQNASDRQSAFHLP